MGLELESAPSAKCQIRGGRDSDEPLNVDTDRISKLEALEHLLQTLREEGSLTEEESNRLESLVEMGLDVLALRPKMPQSL